jgi:hypothetical protein
MCDEQTWPAHEDQPARPTPARPTPARRTWNPTRRQACGSYLGTWSVLRVRSYAEPYSVCGVIRGVVTESRADSLMNDPAHGPGLGPGALRCKTSVHGGFSAHLRTRRCAEHNSARTAPHAQVRAHKSAPTSPHTELRNVLLPPPHAQLRAHNAARVTSRSTSRIRPPLLPPVPVSFMSRLMRGRRGGLSTARHT